MREYNTFDEYIEDTCAQVRCKKAHGDIRRELAAHMDDQKQACMVAGMEEKEAKAEAIRQMGDPVIVGGQLDRTHRPKPNGKLVFAAILMVLAAALVQAFIIKSASYPLYLCIGIALCFAFYIFDYTLFSRYTWVFYALGIGMLLILFVWSFFGNAIMLNGRYYIPFVGNSACLLFLPVYCGLLYNMKGKRYFGLLLSFGLMLPPVFFVLIIPHFTMALILGVSCLVLLLALAAKGWFNTSPAGSVLLILLPIALLVVLYIISNPLILRRLMVIFTDKTGAGYLPSEFQVLLSGAQPLGESTAWATPPAFVNYPEFWSVENMPDLQSADFALLSVIVNHGILWGVALCAVIGAFVGFLFYVARKQKNYFARLIAHGVALTFCIQGVIFVLANTVLPATLTSYPMLFASGTTIVANMILLGIFLSACKWNGVASEASLFHSREGSKREKACA
ncbi:permease prefix domain 1-containing protein [Christensenellaceae bacterium OttesenSCG-928-K19]|nr:permease prefix domain 1-containing protein [Christensenellaceae bacterium OttesenSCG-928-K19]